MDKPFRDWLGDLLVNAALLAIVLFTYTVTGSIQ